MEQHNTHLLSEQSNENHGYEYDNFGNVIADSVDDLIYDKFVDVKNRQRNKDMEMKNLIKNIINNDFSSIDYSQKDSKMIENRRGSMKEKKEKRDSLASKNKSRKLEVKKENEVERKVNKKREKEKEEKNEYTLKKTE